MVPDRKQETRLKWASQTRARGTSQGGGSRTAGMWKFCYLFHIPQVHLLGTKYQLFRGTCASGLGWVCARPSIKELLVQKDPVHEDCLREDCFTCKTGPGRCMRQGVMYSITCTTCKLEGKKVEYYGGQMRCNMKRQDQIGVEKIIWAPIISAEIRQN